jgi:MFS family permease
MVAVDPASKGPTALEMTWPFIVFLGVFAITMPLAGPYIQRMGPRKVTMIGGALCGLGWLAASFATSPYALIPLYGVIGGLGVGIAYGAPITTSAQWFPDRRGLAVGLTVLGFGFSAALVSPISAGLTAYFGGATDPSAIMTTLRVFGVAFIIITVLLAQLLRFPPAGYKPAGWTPPAPAPGAAQRVDFMRNEMSKTSTFYGLWLCYTIGTLAGLTAIGIVGPVGAEVASKLTPPVDAKTAATWVVGLTIPFALCNGLGRPFFGSLTDRLTPRNTAMITYVLILLASLLMYTNYSSFNAFIIAFAILWGCLGGWLAIAPTATASYFGMKDNAKNYGLVFTAYGAGAIIGGLISAFSKDLSPQGYQPFFLIVAILAVLGLIVAFMMMKPPVKKAA